MGYQPILKLTVIIYSARRGPRYHEMEALLFALGQLIIGDRGMQIQNGS